MPRRYRRPSLLLDRDIYSAALIMVKRYGEDAATQAAMRADVLGAENDTEGQREWIRIMEAVKTLQRTRAPGETVN
jgi:hypothetical protein